MLAAAFGVRVSGPHISRLELAIAVVVLQKVAASVTSFSQSELSRPKADASSRALMRSVRMVVDGHVQLCDLAVDVVVVRLMKQAPGLCCMRLKVCGEELEVVHDESLLFVGLVASACA